MIRGILFTLIITLTIAASVYGLRAQVSVGNLEEYVNLRVYLDDFVLPTSNIQNASPAELRLYRYYIQHKFDPIFSLEGTDVESFSAALVDLQASLEKSIVNFSPENRRFIAQKMYPIKFLSTLKTTEQVRREFLQNPSLASARTYHRNLLRTIEAYKTDSDQTEQTLRSFPHNNTLAFLDGNTNTHFVADQIKKARGYAHKRLMEEEHRFSCLYGKKHECARPNSTIIQERLDAPTDTSQSTIATIYRNASDEYAKSGTGDARTSFSITTPDLSDIPTLVLENPSCISNNSTGLYTLWWSTSRMSDSVALRINSIDELLFHDTEKSPGKYYETLNEGGMRHQYQPLNPYFCIDFALDERTIASAHYIQYVLKRNPVFSIQDTVTNPDFSALATIEKKIIQSTELLFASDVKEYTDKVWVYMSEHGEKNLSSIIGKASTENLLHVLGVWRDKSAWFEFTIGNFDDMHISISYVSKYQDIPLYSLFLTRSNFSSLYLLSNETVVSEPIKLIEVPTPIPIEKFHLVNYTDSLSSQFTLKEIEEYIENTGRRAVEITQF
jgi:hypothetical protein